MAKLAEQIRRADRLQDELNQARKAQPQVVKEVKAAPLAIFFNINKANITAKEMINLKYYAEIIKNNPNQVYRVTGYADKETGNSNINMTLSEKRAKNVVEALKAKGIAADRIITSYKGDTVQPYQKPEENRVCICIAE